jgi:adenosylhomocysteine nucleosidase
MRPNIGGANQGTIIGNINNSGFRDISTITHHTYPAAIPEAREEAAAAEPGQMVVGVITVLAEETNAMIEMLKGHRGYARHDLPAHVRVHEALLDGLRGPVRLALLQTADRGQQPSASAFHYLRTHFEPTVFAIVGVAGSISKLDIGDVAVADSVIDYDNRLVREGGVDLRAQIRNSSTEIRRALNHFFTDNGGEVLTLQQPCPDLPERFTVMRGPIGSGGAVITDSDAEIIRSLKAVHQKVLAVETEANGLAGSFYEEFTGGSGLVGWVIVRGISDRADRHKVQDKHATASSLAAHVLERIVPYL